MVRNGLIPVFCSGLQFLLRQVLVRSFAIWYTIIMKMKRRIPYGVMNFEELVRECYFVDNTSYIHELETIKTPVFLRPKRFGKSVWCSVLAHYYDINLKDRFQELFGETDIGNAHRVQVFPRRRGEETPRRFKPRTRRGDYRTSAALSRIATRASRLEAPGRNCGNRSLFQPRLPLLPCAVSNVSRKS